MRRTRPRLSKQMRVISPPMHEPPMSSPMRTLRQHSSSQLIAFYQ